jgi:hypothetical protein
MQGKYYQSSTSGNAVSRSVYVRNHSRSVSVARFAPRIPVRNHSRSVWTEANPLEYVLDEAAALRIGSSAPESRRESNHAHKLASILYELPKSRSGTAEEIEPRRRASTTSKPTKGRAPSDGKQYGGGARARRRRRTWRPVAGCGRGAPPPMAPKERREEALAVRR